MVYSISFALSGVGNSLKVFMTQVNTGEYRFLFLCYFHSNSSLSWTQRRLIVNRERKQVTFAKLISTKSGFRMRNDFRPPEGIPFINKHKTPVGIEWFFKRMATNNNIGMKYYFRHRKWHGRYLFSQMCLAILLLQGPFQRFIARRGRALARTTWILPLKSLWSTITVKSSWEGCTT